MQLKPLNKSYTVVYATGSLDRAHALLVCVGLSIYLSRPPLSETRFHHGIQTDHDWTVPRSSRNRRRLRIPVSARRSSRHGARGSVADFRSARRGTILD